MKTMVVRRNAQEGIYFANFSYTRKEFFSGNFYYLKIEKKITKRTSIFNKKITKAKKQKGKANKIITNNNKNNSKKQKPPNTKKMNEPANIEKDAPITRKNLSKVLERDVGSNYVFICTCPGCKPKGNGIKYRLGGKDYYGVKLDHLRNLGSHPCSKGIVEILKIVKDDKGFIWLVVCVVLVHRGEGKFCSIVGTNKEIIENKEVTIVNIQEFPNEGEIKRKLLEKLNKLKEEHSEFKDDIDGALSWRRLSLPGGFIGGLPEQQLQFQQPQEKTFEDFNGEANGQGEVEENQSQPPPPPQQRHPNTNDQLLVQSGSNPGNSFFSMGAGFQSSSSSNLRSGSVPTSSLGQNQEQAYPQLFQQFLQQQQQQQAAQWTVQPNTQFYQGSGHVQLSIQQGPPSNPSRCGPTNSIQNGVQKPNSGPTPPQQQQQNNSRFMAPNSSTESTLQHSHSAPTVLGYYPQQNQVGSPNFPQPQQPVPILMFCEPIESVAWEINKYRNKHLISEKYIYCDAYIYPSGIQYKVYMIEYIPLRLCDPGINALCAVYNRFAIPIQKNSGRQEYFHDTEDHLFNIDYMCFIQNGEDIFIVTKLFATPPNGPSVENRNPPPPSYSGPSIFLPYPFCSSYRQ